MIYFLSNGIGQVKIGYSTTPQKRVKELQTAHPQTLELMAVCPGDAAREAEYHTKYSCYHINREWFRENRDMSIEIEVLRSMYSLDLTDNDYQSIFAVWVQKTDRIDKRFDREIELLERQIEALDKMRDEETRVIDEEYFIKLKDFNNQEVVK